MQYEPHEIKTASYSLLKSFSQEKIVHKKSVSISKKKKIGAISLDDFSTIQQIAPLLFPILNPLFICNNSFITMNINMIP